MAQQSGLGVAGEGEALDLDDSGDVSMPVGVGQLVCGIEDGVARRLQQGGVTTESHLHRRRVEPLEDVADRENM